MTEIALVKDAPAPAVMQESSSLISLIERAARDPSVDVAKMERMFDMHDRMLSRHAKEAFYASLSKLQSDLPAVARMGTGHNNKKYARFEDIIETIRPHLSKHGFSLTFRVTQDEKTMTTTGVLGHSAGHSEATEMKLPQDLSGNKNPVQAWGSSASYGKRYVTLTLLGIATEDEDDNGKAAGETPAEAPKLETLQQLIRDTNSSVAWFCEHYSVETLEDLTGKQIADAIAGLSAKRRKMQAKP